MSARKPRNAESKSEKKLRLNKETLKDLAAGAQRPGEVKGGLAVRTSAACPSAACPSYKLCG